MDHFTIQCKNLEKSRDYSIINKDIKDPEEIMRELLYRNKNYQEVGRLIKDIWTLGKELMTGHHRGSEGNRIIV